MRRLRGVGKRYRGRGPVLTGVDLDLEPGTVTGIVGGNGSGKSTLLRLIAGLSAPSEGTITGTPSTGYVPDRFPAAQRMSARAYLRHLARIRSLSTVDPAVLLDRLALAGGPDAPLRELSKGNAQKVALAQAVMAEPRLLVLDEPWSGLDAEAHGVLGELIAEHRAGGSAVVFTDHRPDLVAAHADVVFRVEDGRLTVAGDEETARIVLAGNGNPPSVADVLGTLSRDGVVELTVRAAACDAVLLAALRDGWSVREVRR